MLPKTTIPMKLKIQGFFNDLRNAKDNKLKLKDALYLTQTIKSIKVKTILP